MEGEIVRTAALLLQQFGDVQAACSGVAAATAKAGYGRMGRLLAAQYGAGSPAARLADLDGGLVAAACALPPSRAAWYRELVFSRPDLPAASE